ncbi:TPA: DUF551 domain-containing protein [Escherichia coli]|nr:DUF551 domain-containing protein [Escherichia coli]
MINRTKLEHILEYARQQKRFGQHCKIPPGDMVEIVEIAMRKAGNYPVTPDGWISCSERMPEETGDIIVVSDGIVMSGISYSRRDGFYMAALEYDDDEPIDGVTHWMPLPEPPQEVNGG